MKNLAATFTLLLATVLLCTGTASAGPNELVSVTHDVYASGGVYLNLEPSNSHSISADGRFVAFTAQTDRLVKGVSGQYMQVYPADRSSGTIH